LLGKPLGIFSFTWIAVKLKICRLPEEVNWKNLFGICLLSGIGFTLSLFLASLSYEVGSDFLNQAKLGIVFGSVISGIIGYLYLSKVLPPKEK
jgi:NhaA family Na+:H+ antiporter